MPTTTAANPNRIARSLAVDFESGTDNDVSSIRIGRFTVRPLARLFQAAILLASFALRRSESRSECGCGGELEVDGRWLGWRVWQHESRGCFALRVAGHEGDKHSAIAALRLNLMRHAFSRRERRNIKGERLSANVDIIGRDAGLVLKGNRQLLEGRGMCRRNGGQRQ